MRGKVLVIRAPEGEPFGHRCGQLLCHLHGFDGLEVKVVDPGPPSLDVNLSIVKTVRQLQPTLVIFCSSGFDKAAYMVRSVTEKWEKPILLVIISGDETDLWDISSAGFAVVADNTTGRHDGFPALTDADAVRQVLQLA